MPFDRSIGKTTADSVCGTGARHAASTAREASAVFPLRKGGKLCRGKGRSTDHDLRK